MESGLMPSGDDTSGLSHSFYQLQHAIQIFQLEASPKNKCWTREKAKVCPTSVDGFNVAKNANADYKLHKGVGMNGSTTQKIWMEEVQGEMEA